MAYNAFPPSRDFFRNLIPSHGVFREIDRGGPPRSPWADVSSLTCQDDVTFDLAWSELSGCRDGRSYSPRSDMSRLTGRNNVAADVILGPTWSG
ncbi:hypothetical protein B296_00056228 [Ensete ventricosum]|uniref:Uncharacterized protein n=1 Tax=Ensete ventricosum TaxID=4639 RepID=A0A426X534_ENSVE|nr:hypothetical protein B296_00056228 [Ensete ventricosum]